jgi:hypothetical protein
VRTFGVAKGRTLESPRLSHRLLEGELPTSKLQRPEELRVMGAADADLGTSKVDRKSIGAFLSGVGGALYNWQSKKQTCVAVSSTEAEFASASELGKDIKFLRSLIDEMTGGQAVVPSHISEDNTGAIFLMQNNGIVSSMTLVEECELEVDHCPGKLITPGAISKNTPEVHKVHADTMYNGHILPPDYNRSNREDVNILLEMRDEHSLMCPPDRGNDPTVDNDGNGLDRGTESSNRDGTDRCTMTSGRWYRTHAERGGKEME